MLLTEYQNPSCTRWAAPRPPVRPSARWAWGHRRLCHQRPHLRQRVIPLLVAAVALASFMVLQLLMMVPTLLSAWPLLLQMVAASPRSADGMGDGRGAGEREHVVKPQEPARVHWRHVWAACSQERVSPHERFLVEPHQSKMPAELTAAVVHWQGCCE